MSDQTPDFEYDDYDHDDGCTDCIEPTPPSRRQMAVSFVACLALPAIAWAWLASTGTIAFDNGYGVILGVVVFLSMFVVPLSWGWTIVAAIAAAAAVNYWGGERFEDAFSTGLTVALNLVGVVAAVAVVAGWREAGYGAPWRRDSVRMEVKGGIGDLEKFLARSADHLGKHHFAQAMAGDTQQRIIGLSGYAGAGKDTAAAGLIYDLDYTRVAFADKIRDFALAVDDDVVIRPGEPYYEKLLIEDGRPAIMPMSVVLERLNGDWTEAKKIPAVRRRLQRIGYDAGRKVLYDDVWVDAAMRDLPEGSIVITDCRFPEEAKAIRDRGGYVVRVSRPGVDAVNAHATETALDGFDFDAAVINDTTPAAAREQMRNVEDVLYG